MKILPTTNSIKQLYWYYTIHVLSVKIKHLSGQFTLLRCNDSDKDFYKTAVKKQLSDK